MILVGSRAFAIRAPGFMKRKPMDFDFIAESAKEKDDFITKSTGSWLGEPSIGGGVKFVSEWPDKVELDLGFDSDSTSEFVKLVRDDAQTIETELGLVPSLDALFTLKTSHRHKKNSPHFWKTLSDWHLMRALGAKVRPEWRDFLKKREQETYDYKHPSLKRGKSEFFNEQEGIRYFYDHDSIHEAVAIGSEPAYRTFQKQEHEVYCYKDKFFAAPRDVQLNSVLEESAVLAVERSLVPHPGVLTVEQAWRLAFSKVCTSIASGWWREFAYENAVELLKMWPSDFYEKFQAGLRSGVVKVTQ